MPLEGKLIGDSLKNGNINNFSEIDYDDPLVKKWVEEQDSRWRMKYKGFTHADSFELVNLRKEIQKQNKNFTFQQANSIALKVIQTKKKLKTKIV